MKRIVVSLAVFVFGLVPGLSATAQTAPQATIVTVAGTGSTGMTVRGPATSAAIDHPRGIAVLPDGSFVFAEPFFPSVRRVAADGRITVAGTATGVLGRRRPRDERAAEPRARRRAAARRQHGARGHEQPPNPTRFPERDDHDRRRHGDVRLLRRRRPCYGRPDCSAAGIASLADGTILFPDSGNHRVRRISPAGVITTVAGTGTPGSWVTAPGVGGAAQSAVRGLAARGRGFLIADAGNSRIRRVDRNGVHDRRGGAGVAARGRGAADSGGFLVADTMANRVLRVSATRARTTVAGTGAAGFSGDGGPAAQAALNQPKALAVLPDLSGFLVGDSANNRVRLVRMDLRPPFVLRILTKPVRTTGSRRNLRYTLSAPAAVRLEVVRRGRSSCVSATPGSRERTG